MEIKFRATYAIDATSSPLLHRLLISTQARTVDRSPRASDTRASASASKAWVLRVARRANFDRAFCTRNNRGAEARPTAARCASARRMAHAPPTNLTRAFSAAAGNSQASQAAPGSLKVWTSSPTFASSSSLVEPQHALVALGLQSAALCVRSAF